jgi:soluble lytic murein transglycosylase
MVTDEFIDDIPYPETQNYVKKILGTTDDYRRLYGNVTTVDGIETSKAPAAVAASASPAKKAPSTAKKPSSKKPAPKKPVSKKH